MGRISEIFSLAPLLIMLVMLSSPACSDADLYKCISDDGIVKYSDQPCGKKFETITSSPTIDQLIASALPLQQPISDPDLIVGDLVACSKGISASILPKALFQYSNVNVNDKCSRYTIVLVYASEAYLAYNPGRSRMYDIEIKFDKRKGDRHYELWLESISIKQDRRHFSPLAMEQVSNLKKLGPGRWVAHQP